MIKIPAKIEYVIDTLLKKGYDAFIVGGCVRDSLMGRIPDDYDVTTSAKPEEVQKLFDKTIPTGIKHGTITVMLDKTPIEVTTFRTESGYSDSRHPESVSFVSDIKEDLSRRDFTVNAMAYNQKSGLVDFFGGEKDINRKTLRAVGDPEKRFLEDALRILRLFRFASTLKFTCEDSTLSAALNCAQGLKNISGERIFAELYKAANGVNFKSIKPLIESGALVFLKIQHLPDFEKIRKATSKKLAFFMFLHFSSTDSAETLNMLKVSNNLKSYCKALSEMLLKPFPQTSPDLKRLLCEYSADDIKDYLTMKSILEGCDTSPIITLLNDIVENCEPYLISHLDISGEDLKGLGFKGKQIGEMLKNLQGDIILNPKLNKKELLLEKLNKISS